MIPVLGPVQEAALAVLAAADGMTAAEVAERLGRDPRSIHQATQGLRDKGCIAVLTHRRRVGVSPAVWVATSTGRRALAARQQEAAS